MTKSCRTNRQTPIAACAAGIALCLGLGGCSSPSPKYDSQMGDSLQRAKQAQTVLPTPAQRRTPAPAVTSSEVQRAVTATSSGQPANITSGSSLGGGSGGSSSSGSSSVGGSTAVMR